MLLSIEATCRSFSHTHTHSLSLSLSVSAFRCLGIESTTTEPCAGDRNNREGCRGPGPQVEQRREEKRRVERE